MTLVVSDASPINILVRLELIDLLPRMFGQVRIPPAVVEELSSDDTPASVRDFISRLPPWLVVQAPSQLAPQSMRRHRGELEAIELAVEIRADAILIDEAKGRRQALSRGLLVVGTIGLLEKAADVGLVENLARVHDQLRVTDFRVHENLLVESLAQHQARRSVNDLSREH